MPRRRPKAGWCAGRLVSSGPPPTRAERDLVYRLAFNEDLTHWIVNDPRTAVRVMRLIEATHLDPVIEALHRQGQKPASTIM